MSAPPYIGMGLPQRSTPANNTLKGPWTLPRGQQQGRRLALPMGHTVTQNAYCGLGRKPPEGAIPRGQVHPKRPSERSRTFPKRPAARQQQWGSQQPHCAQKRVCGAQLGRMWLEHAHLALCNNIRVMLKRETDRTHGPRHGQCPKVWQCPETWAEQQAKRLAPNLLRCPRMVCLWGGRLQPVNRCTTVHERGPSQHRAGARVKHAKQVLYST